MLWITSLLPEAFRAARWARPEPKTLQQGTWQSAASPTSAPLYAASRSIHHWAPAANWARSAAADATTKAAKTAAAAAEQVSAPHPPLRVGRAERRLPSRHDERRADDNTQKTAVKNVSLPRAGVASGAPHVGKLTSYSISSGPTQIKTRAPSRAHAATLIHVGSR